jgi:excisionase family DNA binding protein
MIFRLLRNQQLRSIKVGRLRRVPMEAVTEFIATHHATPDEEE